MTRRKRHASAGRSGGPSSASPATSRTRPSSTRSPSSPSWPGSASAPTASRPPRTAPKRPSRPWAEHTYLALALAVATALTVFIISYAYSRIIEYFPSGGGGYIVATHTLGEKAGVVSGIGPARRLHADDHRLHRRLRRRHLQLLPGRLPAVQDPLRGHGHRLPRRHQPARHQGIGDHAGPDLRRVRSDPCPCSSATASSSTSPRSGPWPPSLRAGFQGGLATIGLGGMALLFLRAFSMGGGTYTGIEAVSNGLQILREPRVQNGKKTMVYMSVSLALTAGGILVCYLLLGVSPVAGKTLNAVLAGEVFGGWSFGGVLALVTIFTEGAILLVAAQAGFVDGPRVMGNMAVDYWFPHRFASLSSRLTMQNGVLLMGGAAILLLLYSRGRISTLIVMYSINVFLTFSLSQLGMSRFFIKNRRTDPHWKKHLPVHLIGLAVCLAILTVTVLEKFTPRRLADDRHHDSVVVATCYLVKGHYNRVRRGVRELDDMLVAIPHKGTYNAEPTDPREMTAVQLVGGYNGFGVHTFLSIIRGFPGLYKNFVFVSVAEVDAGAFKEIRVGRAPDGSDQGRAQEVRRDGP
ncbi:MAG: APC family permease [Candidatus Moduliflexus flocculans]|nr:APC family permease [Candidatus Moduliflexus flocculans]